MSWRDRWKWHFPGLYHLKKKGNMFRTLQLKTLAKRLTQQKTKWIPIAQKSSISADLMPSLKRMENGVKVKNTFSKDEMHGRISKLRKHMEENSIGAVLFTSVHNVNYYSDFMYCSFGRTFGAVVTMDKVTTFSAGIDGDNPGEERQWETT
ncbi:hypothetical protein BSL78_12816 [Apostichopus japonicus]|uniref:Creatinase N-terminal domain-containing protein n=1 Tax=Stichopus japonicus TaxID=307972 RepID=A0A2G8KQL4_STIJA|nr:hypothetical protein BSL78_12816 [Apostichopus japonicus]